MDSYCINKIKQNLRVVILHSPYSDWEDSEMQFWFSKMVELKKKGYSPNYSSPVLPVDTTDFFCTHIIASVQEESGIIPIMGYKTTSLEQTLRNNFPFPGLSLVNSALAEEHTRAIEEIIQRCEKDPKSLAYLGSWTVNREFKQGHPHLKSFLRELFEYLYCRVYEALNVQNVIIGGTLRFKTHEVFEGLGHEALKLEEKELPPIEVRHLAGEKVLVMHSDRVPDSSSFDSFYNNLWSSKLEYGTRPQYFEQDRMPQKRGHQTTFKPVS